VNLWKEAVKMYERQLNLPFLSLVLILVFSSACNSRPRADAPTVPLPAPTSSVSVTKDVVYATSLLEDGATWTLDVYTPLEGAGWPVVILMHGLGANKEGYVRASEIVAESGATVYAVTWPAQAVDVAALDNARGFREISETLNCALRFALVTATDFGGDARRVTLVAHSYGALYGVWIALASGSLDAQWEEFAARRGGPAAQVECARNSDSARVDGFVGIGGGRYTAVEVLQGRDAELWEIASPFSHLGRNLELPIRLLHGDRDTLASPESSQTFNSVLVEAGYDSRVILFDGGHIVPPQLTFETVIELASK
jgi:predicted esterase